MNKLLRNKCYLIGLCSVLFLLNGCAAGDNEQTLSQNPSWTSSLKTDLAGLPDDVIVGAKQTYSQTDNLTILALAGAASVAMHNSGADRNLNENFDNHQVIDGFMSEFFNTIGSPGTHFAATGLWYAISVNNQDEFNKNRAWTMMTALSVTGITTVGLKAIRNNENPNGDDWAWPSGHTSSSFTVASVLDEFYGPQVGIPAYILASLVGYRQADEGDHWASDVVFGAALGWAVGHTIAGDHKKLEVADFDILPYIGIGNNSTGSTVGISLYKSF